jgi:hypothetical protein
LEQLAQHTEEKLDKHKFLVQSRVIDDQDYNRIIVLSLAQRDDEVSIHPQYLLLLCAQYQHHTPSAPIP